MPNKQYKSKKKAKVYQSGDAQSDTAEELKTPQKRSYKKPVSAVAAKKAPSAGDAHRRRDTEVRSDLSTTGASGIVGPKTRLADRARTEREYINPTAENALARIVRGTSEGRAARIMKPAQDRYAAQRRPMEAVEAASKHVEMDPYYGDQLAYLSEQLGGQAGYEQDQYAKAAQQIMQSSQLEGQIGQTTQAMGSRGMGRVAQLQRASSLDMLTQLTGAQAQAKRDALDAGLQVSGEIRAVMDQNLKAQAAKHEWDDNVLKNMQNESNDFMTAQQNMLANLIETGHMESDGAWERFGEIAKQAWEEWNAAETTEERIKITQKYYAATAEFHNQTVTLDDQGNPGSVNSPQSEARKPKTRINPETGQTEYWYPDDGGGFWSPTKAEDTEGV